MWRAGNARIFRRARQQQNRGCDVQGEYAGELRLEAGHEIVALAQGEQYGHHRAADQPARGPVDEEQEADQQDPVLVVAAEEGAEGRGPPVQDRIEV